MRKTKDSGWGKAPWAAVSPDSLDSLIVNRRTSEEKRFAGDCQSGESGESGETAGQVSQVKRWRFVPRPCCIYGIVSWEYGRRMWAHFREMRMMRELIGY